MFRPTCSTCLSAVKRVIFYFSKSTVVRRLRNVKNIFFFAFYGTAANNCAKCVYIWFLFSTPIDSNCVIRHRVFYARLTRARLSFRSKKKNAIFDDPELPEVEREQQSCTYP